ncbi:MAG: TadE/TadG family type IV pilus assembly protein [Acetobacterales bacterium]
MARFRDTLRHIRDDLRGAVSAEFGVLVPVLLFLFLGSIEVVNLVRVERKLVVAAQTAANLATLQASITAADVADVFRAAELVMQPFDAAPMAGALASVRYAEPDGTPSVDWQDSLRGGTVPEPAAQAVGLGLPGESVVIVRLTYAYRPLLSGLVIGEVDLDERAFARPRRSGFVALN